MSGAERWVARPLGELVTGVARAVAEGQTELDRASLATRRDVRRAVENGDLETPIETPWFRFSGVEADLNVSLSMRGRPEHPGGVFHKAQIMQDANGFFLDIALAAEKVDQLAEFGRIEKDGQGVDGKVAPEGIFARTWMRAYSQSPLNLLTRRAEV